MHTLRLLLLALVCTLPAVADGWFSEPFQRRELVIRYQDPIQVRVLLATLVPDLTYEVRGRVLRHHRWPHPECEAGTW
ncbi:MAG: hypothetical protein KC910_24320 [Candidatus Eremiobacteraeota bacterium]|nr:hypothetical protein [Candidatus Eremiobacteraeota bacterium]